MLAPVGEEMDNNEIDDRLEVMANGWAGRCWFEFEFGVAQAPSQSVAAAL